MFTRRIPWTRQPPCPQPIDFSHPLSKDLVIANDRGINCLCMSSFTRVGTKRGVINACESLGFNSTVGIGTTDSINTNYNTHGTTRTYFALLMRTGAGGGNFGRVFEKRVAGAQVEALYNNASDTRIYFLRTFSSGGGNWTTSNGVELPLNTLTTIALSFDESSATNDPKIYIGGVSQTILEPGTPYGSAVTNTDNYIIGNRLNDNARCFDGWISLFFAWNRILSDNDIASLHLNPWQLFLPRKSLDLYQLLATTSPIATVNIYNGSTFVPKPILVYNGTTWINARAVKHFNGTTWI